MSPNPALRDSQPVHIFPPTELPCQTAHIFGSENVDCLWDPKTFYALTFYADVLVQPLAEDKSCVFSACILREGTYTDLLIITIIKQTVIELFQHSQQWQHD